MPDQPSTGWSATDSADPQVAAAWAKPRGKEDYDRLAAAWRSQDPKWSPNKQEKK